MGIANVGGREVYQITVGIVILLSLGSSFDYVQRAWKKETSPVPATWILMVVMMSLSFWMYMQSPQRSWTANIGVTVGLLNVSIILVGVIAANIRHNTLRIAFDTTQKWCLVSGAGVTVLWLFVRQPLLSYVLVQCIAFVAYVATVKRLWSASKSTEPVFIWACMLTATIVALYPAWKTQDLFSWIYLGRAIPSTSFVIFLIMRAKKRALTDCV